MDLPRLKNDITAETFRIGDDLFLLQIFWPSKIIKAIVDCEINYTIFGKLISHLFKLKLYSIYLTG